MTEVRDPRSPVSEAPDALRVGPPHRTPAASPGKLMPVAYNLGLLLLSPLLALYLTYRLVIRGKSRSGLPQRLGWAPRLGPAPPAGRVWLHAVSAGEVVAAAAIARRLADLSPATEVVISSTTPAGRQQAERLIPQARAWFYFPFDFLPCVALAYRRLRPTAVAAVETEIWPNWLYLARVCRIPTALLNGQFADRGFRGARKARWLYRWALGQLDTLAMQSAQAAERACFLGAPTDRVRLVGNAKFEQADAVSNPAAAAAVRGHLRLDSGRPLWIAGSTHPGEEEMLLDAFQVARGQEPELALLLAPRHVERAVEVARLAAERGWRTARRSETAGAPAEVLVLDTMGELAGLYALADMVFVGGSLAPIGGHDILQPLIQGKPTFFGPHMHNQQDLTHLALAAGAAVQVADAAELAEMVLRVLREPALGDRLRAAGRELLSANQGAALEYARLIARMAPRA